MHFKLVTPERTVFQEDGVLSVTLPTSEGEITILPGHIPLVAKLKPGVALLKLAGGKEEDVAVSGGFIQVTLGDKIKVLADTAERGAELSLEVIEAAKLRAEVLMKENIASNDVQFAHVVAQLERELARYKTAIKYAKRRSNTVPNPNAK